MPGSIPPPGKRLATLCDLVPPGARVADVGCDHGLLSAWLLATGRADRCVATEVDAPRLDEVRARFAGQPWSSRLEFRPGDGLGAVLPEDGVDVAVIAGLGGRAIARILESGRQIVAGLSRLIVQPQTEPEIPRRSLVDLGFRFVDERIVSERARVYELMAAEPGDETLEHETLSAEDLLAAGPHLVRTRSPDALALWRARLAYFRSIAGQEDARGDGRAAAREGEERARRIVAALSGRG